MNHFNQWLIYLYIYRDVLMSPVSRLHKVGGICCQPKVDVLTQRTLVEQTNLYHAVIKKKRLSGKKQTHMQ